MRALIHYTLEDPGWVLPDRNTIPHDVPSSTRGPPLVGICIARRALAIGA